MEMVLITVEKLREIIIEGASVAVKHHSPRLAPVTEPDELLTPEETAKLLKVSKVTVWDWEKRGILKKHTIGNQVRYLRSEVVNAVIKRDKVIAQEPKR